jgi:DNA-binding NarL/FixJ family response regulator
MLQGRLALMRVLVADANTLIRTGIQNVIGHHLSQSRVEVVWGEASSAAEALCCLRDQRWDLCLMDIALPQRGGLEILRHMRESGRQTEVLFLSSYPDRQYTAAALRLGARGLLHEDCTREELRVAFGIVVGGGCYVSPKLSDQLIGTSFDAAPSHARLSQREFQIFQKLARGTAITVIGQELCISPKSVSTYRSRILEKMRCTNNAEITQYAMRAGLI